ncbi:MAG: hypothetical protein V4706_08940 [Pseudomonadota bacterium]
MKKYLLLGLLAASTLVTAQTATMSRDEYRAAKQRIEAQEDTEEARCAALQGNAKDVCEEEAEGREKVARAELEQRYEPSARNIRKLAMARINAVYDVAKEKCEALTGAAEDSCEKQAKSERDSARAQVKK